MNTVYTFKNLEPSDHLREYADKRFAKLAKFMNADPDTAELQANLSVDKVRQMAEVVVIGDQMHLSAYAESEDMYATIDLVVDKLQAQITKISEKTQSKRRAVQKAAQAVLTEVFSFAPAEEGGPREKSIVASDRFEPKPMDVEEAALQLETLEEDFLVFFNAETERINVIHVRKDGDFGVIDPGF